MGFVSEAPERLENVNVFHQLLFIMSKSFPVSILKIFKDLKIKGDTGAGKSEGLVSGTENTETHTNKEFIIRAKVSTVTTNGDLKDGSNAEGLEHLVLLIQVRVGEPALSAEKSKPSHPAHRERY